MVEDGEPDAALRAAAEVVVARLRALAESLEPSERAVLATLLAPALAEDEVVGFGAGDDGHGSLPDAVADVVHQHRLRVVER